MASGRDVSVFFKAVDMVTAPIRDMNTRVQGFVSGVSGLMKGLTAALGGLAFGKFFKDATEAASEAQSANTRLAQAVENVGGSFEKIAPAAKQHFDQIEKTTRFSSEDASEAMTRLVTLTGNHDRALALLNVTADVAAYKQIDMASAAEIVGKVSNGNTKVLKEFGVEVKEGGNAIELLSGRLKGQAEKEGKDWNGMMARGKNALGNIVENIGTAIISNDALGGAIEGVVGWFTSLAGWIEENESAIDDFVTGVSTLAGWVRDLAGWIKDGLVGALNFLAVMWENNRYEAEKWELKSRAAAGGVLKALGELIVGAKNFLKKLGIDVGDGMAEAMAKSGQRMVSQSAADLTVLDQTHKDRLAQIYGTLEKHEQKTTTLVTTSGAGRISLMKDQAAGISAEAKERLLALADLQTKAVIQILDVTLRGEMEMSALTKKRFEEALKHTGGIEGAIATIKTSWDRYSEATADATKEEDERFLKLVNNVSGFARGLIDAGAGSGLLSDNLAKGLSSAVNLGEAIAKIVKATTTGDLLSGLTLGVGALVSLGKTIFGGNKELQAAFMRNADKLDSLRSRIGDLIQVSTPGNRIAAVQASLGSIDFKKLDDATKAGGADFQDKMLRQILGKDLLARGASLSDVEQLAKDLGIEIKDKNGKLIPKLVAQLLEAIGTLDPGFANNFAGQRERIRQGVGIGSVTNELGEAVKLISDPTKGAPAIAKALEGLDLSTAGGKAAGVTALQGVFSNIGNLKFSDFGGLNEAEFRDAITWLVDLLQAAPAASDSKPGADTPTTGGTGEVPSLSVDRPTSSVAPAPVLVTFGDAREWLALDMMAKQMAAIGTALEPLAATAPSAADRARIEANAQANAERQRAEAGGSGGAPLIGNVENLIVQIDERDDPREIAAKVIEATRRDLADDLRYYRRAAGSGTL